MNFRCLTTMAAADSKLNPNLSFSDMKASLPDGLVHLGNRRSQSMPLPAQLPAETQTIIGAKCVIKSSRWTLN
jgi:hypothetical protein